MDNPLFVHYGRLCEKCFVGDLQSPDSLTLFFDAFATPSDSHFADEKKGKLSDHADPEQRADVTRSAERLRHALLAESQHPEVKTASSITQKFQQFQKGVAQGSEAMLNENPFYELTVLIYQLNLTAVKNAFVDSQKGRGTNLPSAMKISRSIRYLWSREGSMAHTGEKVRETLGSILSIGKILLGVLLFVGSTLTTAKGVNDLVQLEVVVALFGDFLVGEKHETIRLFMTLTVGVVLSSIILDFKSRLFQGVAEVGRIWAGFWEAFKRFPRWMLLSSIFAMASIWTNYDGIVLFFSKTQDLSYQWQIIEDRVARAIGDAREVDTRHPDSLTDLKGLMAEKIRTTTKQFHQVVEDESMGVASSGVASKGPRYWAKYFIIQGGYQPGQNDVVQSLAPSPFNRQLDHMLQTSDLDLSLSLETRLKAIFDRYQQQFTEMETTVHQKMNVLADTMTLSSFSVAELTALFNLEAYHVNQSVHEVVALMEANKKAFEEAVAEINPLVQAYIDLLTRVDRAGVPTDTKYTIDVHMEIPRVEAIDQLNQSQIPMAERRSVLALKSLLMERYGTFLGSFILFGILFIAVFMDHSDPIFYSAMVARWGRKDRLFLRENIKRFEGWEKEHIQRIRAFLAQPDIRVTLPHIPCPITPVLHWHYHQYLESQAPFVKDYPHLKQREKFRFWFFGLFSTTRIRYAEIYNARQSITRKMVSDPKTQLPPLLNRLYGTLFRPFSVDADHFNTRHEQVIRAMADDEKKYRQQIATISHLIGTAPAEILASDSADNPQPLRHYVLSRLNHPQGKGDGRFLFGSFRSLFHLIFFKSFSTSTFDFSLTRNNWMVQQAMMERESHARVASLSSHIPVLTQLLSERFPVIKNQILKPLFRSLEEIPHHQALQSALKISSLQKECLKMEQELFCVLGMSYGHGLPMDHPLFCAILENSCCPEIPKVFLARQQDISVFERRLTELEEQLRVAHGVVQELVTERNRIVSTLTRARTDSLRPCSLILEKFKYRKRLEEALGFYTLRRDISFLDGFVTTLWGGEVRLDLSNETEEGDGNKRGQQLGVDRIFSRLSPDEGDRPFSLLQAALELEEKLAKARVEIEKKVFLLTFLDKSIDKAEQLIGNAFRLIAHIFIQEARLLEEKQQAQKQEQKKGESQERLHFMADHHLFFQAVPLFLETNRGQLFSVAQLAALIETGEVNPLRSMERDVHKIHAFLQASLSYLNGERGRMGIVAPLDLMDIHRGAEGASPNPDAVSGSGEVRV